jgi:biopolymer transport protein ExbB
MEMMSEILLGNLDSFRRFISEGGPFFMVPLLILNAMLWYGIGYRFHALQRGFKGPLKHLLNSLARNGSHTPRGLLDGAATSAIKAIRNHTDNLDIRLDEALYPYRVELKKFKGLVNIIVLVAPLIGLLGTVDGMIEMFQALVSGQLFSQGGGIAAGVAKALSTTELGLIVAVPGIILHHILISRENRLEEEMYQLKFLLLGQNT